MTNNISFETCSIQELPVLQTLCITTFYAAYHNKNKPQNMQKYLSSAFNTDRLTKELSNPNTQIIFLKKDKEVLGYFKINENEAQTDFQTANSLELERIYILPELQGNNYGKIMLEETIRIAKSKGKSKIWLGVWENNPNAVRFYERNGFTVTGEHGFMFVDKVQVNLIMEVVL